MHRVHVLGSTLLAALLSVAVGDVAEARECGGRRICRCGDQVTADYELVGDLGPCEKHGLTLRAGVTLDGGGHALRGSRAKSSAGVVLDEKATGARVVNLEVTGFARGVRFAGVDGARIEKVESHHNGDPVAHKGYGIDVARGASNNVIQNVHVHHNADEGIHIGNDARGNRVVSARVEDNYREQVYFLANEDNSLEDSTLVGGGASAVFIKHAKGVRVQGNRIDGRGIQIRGESSGVRLVDNQLTGQGLTIQPYEKGRRGKTVPRDVILSGGKVSSPAACIRLIEARDIRLESAGLDCKVSVELAGGTDLTSVDTLVRRVTCAGPGILREEVRAEVRFVDASREPVAGVQIVDGAGQVAGRSGEDGSWKGSLPSATVRCPGPQRSPAPEIVLRAGTWSRRLPPGELTGDISVGEE